MKRKLFVGLLLVIVVVLLSACASWKVTEPVEPPEQAAVEVDVPAPVADVVIDEIPTENTGLDTLLNFLLNLAGLVPVVAFGAPLIAFIVDLLKRIPKFGLPNNYAPLASGLLNLALYAILFVANDKQDEAIKGVTQGLTTLAPFILMLFTSLLATAGAHDKLADRGLGYSRTGTGVKGMLRGG